MKIICFEKVWEKAEDQLNWQ